MLTPLVLDDGSAVLVNRGFLGFDRDGVIDPPPAPEGEVIVDGLLLESEQRGRFGASDPDEGTLAVLARVELDVWPSRWTTTCCRRTSSSSAARPVR